MYQFDRLLLRIAKTRPAEMDCGECAAFVPTFVDAILEECDDGHFDSIRLHMFQCSVCAQEFGLLRELATLCNTAAFWGNFEISKSP